MANSKWCDVIATGDSKPHRYVQAHGSIVYCASLWQQSRHLPFANMDDISLLALLEVHGRVHNTLKHNSEVKCGTR